MTLQSQSQTKRGRPRNLKSHRAILDATYTLLKTEGVQATSIERIAAESGVAKQTIYRWWDGRADIVLELMIERANIQMVKADTCDFRSDLYAFLSQFFDLCENEIKPLLRAQFLAIMNKPEYVARFRQAIKAWRVDYYEALFDKAKSRGELRAGCDPEQYWEIFAGLIWYRVLFQDRPISRQDARFYADLIADQVVVKASE